MFFLKAFISSLILPPTVLVLAAVGGLLLCRKRLRLGRAVIAASLLVLMLLSTPWLASALQRSLEIYGPIQPNSIRQAQAIVILGAGTYRNAPEFGGVDTLSRNALARVRYAAYLQRQSGLPILAAGGAPHGGRSEAEAMRDVLEGEFHVTARWLEKNSVNTAENAQNSSEILAKAGISTVALVTDAIHMPRAKLMFENNGFTVMPAPTGFTTGPPGFDPYLFLPSAGALGSSAYAMHEWLGLSLARIH